MSYIITQASPDRAVLHSNYSGDSPVVGLFKICENCGKNFFRCVSSSVEHCCNCFEQLHRTGKQLWTCLKCGTSRAWGTGAPAETVAKDLGCCRCVRVTVHEFWKVA